MRAEPRSVLELLWQHPEVPRSVLRCLGRCGTLLRESTAQEITSAATAVAGVEDLALRLKRIDWTDYVRQSQDEDRVESGREELRPARPHELEPLLKRLLDATAGMHSLIADTFLNHQARIAQVSQPVLHGLTP